MGIDTNTYRCRVGMFVHSVRAVMLIFYINFSVLAKIVGTVSFIRILLLIAGIEQNPGPTDQFIYRYQYLLIEVGTKILRQLFDNQVGNDINNYLNMNPKQDKQLKFLVNKGIINDDQKKVLPPIDKTPNSAKFDITLLCCLLKNICGLSKHTDVVWKTPVTPGDLSLEADITRLRECRNNLSHTETVFADATELNVKWNELSMILNRLNKIAKITDLASLISDARGMVIDERLKEDFDDLVKSWREMDELFDHGIGEVMMEVTNVRHEVSGLKSDTEQIKDNQKNQASALGDVKSDTEQIQQKQENQARALGDVKSDTEQIQEKQENQVRALGDVKSDTEQIQQKQENQARALGDVKSDTEQIKEKQENQARALGDVKSDTEQIQENLTGLTAEIRGIKMQRQPRPHVDELSDIQKVLINFYKRHFETLPVLPVLETKDADIIFHYVSPTMHSIGEGKKDAKEIECFRDMFCKGDKSYNEIYITGDAGVGEASFCRHLCFLWCRFKCGHKIEKEYEYLSKFDCVFYINLRDTEHCHVVDMIKESYFKHQDPLTIINILSKTNCLIVLDGLDEWNPKKDGKKTHELPERLHYENCVYLTSCRPYRIELGPLSSKDVDHQIYISGIHGKSLNSYIEHIINYMNKKNNTDRKLSDFESDIKKCGLTSEISIPIIVSQLVVLWYENTLEGMTRAVIYANILEMLFERAKQRNVRFPTCISSTFQLPDSLSGLIYLNKYVSLLYNVCYLSFCTMFKQDQNVSNLVFTRIQLHSEPYCFSDEEIDFLCKIGILSTNEDFECISEKKLKISFIHKSYLEFFAALFISSFDSKNSFTDVTKTWKCLNDVVQYKNVFLLLAGFSLNSIISLFENIYLALSDDLTSCRRNALFHYDNFPYRNRIRSLQDIVVSCFKEVSISNDKTVELRMEDCFFSFYDSSDVDILIKRSLLNTTNVKSLHCYRNKYFDEFDQIKNLLCIDIDCVSSDDFVKFTQCMLQNTSTLNTVCIQGDYDNKPLISDLLVRSLHYLTSLSLSHVKIKHDSLYYLVKFLSNNFLMENIKLDSVFCDDHQDDDSDCTLTLNLLNHKKLTSLYLWNVNILCNNVNNSSLKFIKLRPLCERIVRLCYSDLFNCIKNSQLEHHFIDGFFVYMSDNTMKTLTSTVKTLPYIKSLELWFMKLPDDVLLQLHPQVTQVEIKLRRVTMSRQCFHCFVESCVNKKSEIKVKLFRCKITSDDGETHSELSEEESMIYMSEHLESFSTITITQKHGYCKSGDWLDYLLNTGYSLHFETTKCQ